VPAARTRCGGAANSEGNTVRCEHDAMRFDVAFFVRKEGRSDSGLQEVADV